MLIRTSKLNKERPLELLLPANLNHKVDRHLQEGNPHQHHQEANLDPHHLNRLREVSLDLLHLNSLREVNPDLHLLDNLSHLDKSLLKLVEISPQLVALSLRHLLEEPSL